MPPDPPLPEFVRLNGVAYEVIVARQYQPLCHVDNYTRQFFVNACVLPERRLIVLVSALGELARTRGVAWEMILRSPCATHPVLPPSPR